MKTPLLNSQSYPEQHKHIEENMAILAATQPTLMRAFGALHIAGTTTNALDDKVKELIALAIAVTSRCDGCIAFHTKSVLNAGASHEEINDALGVAILMGGGPAVVYATHVVDAIKQFEEEERK